MEGHHIEGGCREQARKNLTTMSPPEGVTEEEEGQWTSSYTPATLRMAHKNHSYMVSPPPPEEEEGGVGSCRPVPCGPTHIPPVGLGKARGLS